MFFRLVYDEKLAQAAYVIGCQRSGEAIVIDPQRDVDRYLRLCQEHGLRLTAVAETHIHADFLSGARELAERARAMVYVSGEGGPDWQSEWVDPYRHARLRDGESFSVGHIEFQAVHTPGHTPEHLCYVVTDRGGGADAPMGVVTGDFLFVGDLGRPDLLESAAGQAGAKEPAARALRASVDKLASLDDFLQVWPGHGAGSACGKALGAVPISTLGYERRFNAGLLAARSESEFLDYILTGQPAPPLYFARMKRDNRRGPALLGELPSPGRLDLAASEKLNGREVAIVDTRPWDQFRAAHAPGALSLPLTRSFPTDAGSLVREDEQVCLVVNQERLEEAIRDLVRIGLDRFVGWLPADEAPRTAGAVATPEIGVAEARVKIEQHAAPVLDVRSPAEFAAGHIPGAINIPHTRLAARLDDVPRDTPLVVHCQGGVRSARATSLLQRAGFDATNLKGGYAAWEKSGSPTSDRK